MPATSILAFWGTALLLIAVPGPDWAFTVSAGLRDRVMAPAVSGLVIGYAGMTVIVAAGVGTLVSQTPQALTALTVAGGGYLMWLGTRTLAAPSDPFATATAANGSAEAAKPTRSGWAALAEGVGVSGLNPKGLLIFVALLPQFTATHRLWPVAVQIIALGLVFMLTCAVFYLSLGSLTRTVLHSHPSAARTVSRLSGAAMILIGAWLIIARLI